MKHYGILANPAGHSLSPVMQNAAFKELGIDAQYAKYEIPLAEFGEFMERVKHEPINGLSVSLPYKKDVIPHLNVADDDVKAIGACNTVHNKGGLLYGHNTDYIGSNMALKEQIENLRGLNVCVMGTGGAARSIVYGLKKEGANVFVIGRSDEKASKFANEMGVSVGDRSMAGDILIQATSIWTLEPEASVEDFCPQEFVAAFDVVMDIIYRPISTPLLEMAAEMGKMIITGEKMLLYQGAAQFEIWTGEKAPLVVMEEALLANL